VSGIRRREFVILLGGGAAAGWPLAAHAQRPSIPVIGFLDATTAADTVYRVSAFRDGLKEAGFIDGHNVAIDFRWAENKLDQLPGLAADLVQRQVAVIVGPNTAMRAVRPATSTIPIVFVSGGDPLASGLVTNLSRPGGNITGVSFASSPLQPRAWRCFMGWYRRQPPLPGCGNPGLRVSKWKKKRWCRSLPANSGATSWS
jgi:putative ABC transport system substrate-binding protein